METAGPTINIASFFPEIVLFGTVLFLTFMTLFKVKFSSQLGGYVAAIGILAAGVAVAFTNHGAVLGDIFSNDSSSQLFKLFFLLAALFTLLMNQPRDSAAPSDEIFSVILILLSVIGMMFLSMSMSLLSLFVSLELSAMPLLVLAVFYGSPKETGTVGLKISVLTFFSALLILLGLAFLFGLSGALNLIVMKLQIAIIHITNHQIGVIILLSIVMVLAGVVMRLGLMPFHRPAVELHNQISVPLAAFISIGLAAAVVLFFAKLFINGLFAFYGPEMNPNDWGRLVGFAIFANFVFATVKLYQQRDMVSLLFYSNIIQIGFVLMGLASMRAAGIQGAGFYLAAFLLAGFGVYAVVNTLQKSNGRADLESLKGLSKSSMSLAVLLSIFLMSLAGVPLLAGFVAKYSIIEAALDRAGSNQPYHWMYLLIAAAVLSAVFVLIKFARITLSLFVPADKSTTAIKIPIAVKVVLAVALLGTLYFGILPNWLLSFASGIPGSFGFIIE